MKKKILGIFLVLFLAVTLVACGGGASKADVQEVQDALDLASSFSGSPATEGITRDQAFSTKLRDFPEVTITWSSSHPALLTNAGKISRPAPGEADVLVTMTVTATKVLDDKKKTEVTESKEVKFLVLAELEAESVTLSDLYDEKVSTGTNKFTYDYLGELVEFEELTVVGIYANKNGFYLTDGVRLLFVYNPTLGKTVKLDEVYKVKGTFGHNFGTAQLSDDTEITLVEDGTPKAAPFIDATVDAEFQDNNNYDGSFLFEPKGYNLTGRVLVDTSDGESNYTTYLVNPSYEGYKIVKTVSGGKAVAFEAPTVLIYYQGIVDQVSNLDGKKITIPYFPAGKRSDRGGLNYGVFLDKDALIELEDTPEEQFGVVKNLVKKIFEGKEILDLGNQLDLPATIQGYDDLTITWKSSTPTIVTDTGEIIGRPAVGATVGAAAKMVATVTFGSNAAVDITMDFTIMPTLDVQTVADAASKAKGTLIRVEGLVNQYEPKNFHIFDGTTGITMRDNGDLLKTMSADKSYVVTGYIDEFNDVKQISVAHVEESATAVVVTNSEVTAATDLSGVLGHLIDMEIDVTSTNSDDYGNLYINFKLGDKSYSIKADDRITDLLDQTSYTLAKDLTATEAAPIKVKVTGTTYVGTRFYFSTATILELV